MLYMPPGTSLPVRVHGAFVSDDEVHRLVDEWKQRGEPDYIQDILDGADEGGSGGFDGGGGGSSSSPSPPPPPSNPPEPPSSAVAAVMARRMIRCTTKR